MTELAKSKRCDILKTFNKEKRDSVFLIDYVPGCHGFYLEGLLNDIVGNNQYSSPFMKTWNGAAHNNRKKIDSDVFIALHMAVFDNIFDSLVDFKKVTITINKLSSYLMVHLLAMYRTSEMFSVDLEQIITDADLEKLRPGGDYDYGWIDLVYNNVSRPVSRYNLRKALVDSSVLQFKEYVDSINSRLMHNSVAQVPFECFYNLEYLGDVLTTVTASLTDWEPETTREVWSIELQKSFADFQKNNPFSEFPLITHTIINKLVNNEDYDIPPLHIGLEAMIVIEAQEKFGVKLVHSETFFTNTRQILDQLL